MYGVQRLLWDLRRDTSLAERFRRDAESVMGAYDLDDVERDALVRRDFKVLYDREVNPYLLYFFALQIGVDRAAYYANLRGGTSGGTR